MSNSSFSPDIEWAESVFWLSRLSNIQKTLTKSLSVPIRDTDRPRTPPLPPTEIVFPQRNNPTKPNTNPLPGQSLHDLFGRRVKKHLLLTSQHIEALNLQVEHDVSLDQLVPESYLPPQLSHVNSSQDEKSKLLATKVSNTKLNNGAAAPNLDVYERRMKELFVDNEDAFRYIQRQPPRSPQPSTPIRIAHFRKFYESLLTVSEYWDTSLDRYHTDIVDWVYDSPKIMKEREHAEARKEHPNDDSIPKPKVTYTGLRHDTGRHMPEQIREYMVRGFVEPIAWSFECRWETPRPGVQPRFQMHNLLLPIKQSGTIYRTPPDRQRAKAGIIEGPLFGIQCRPETSFPTPRPPPTDDDFEDLEYMKAMLETETGEDRERLKRMIALVEKFLSDEGVLKSVLLDLAREVGAMLLIAQERAREGQKEDKLNDRSWAKGPELKRAKTQADTYDSTDSTDGVSSNPYEKTLGWKSTIPNDRQKREVRGRMCTPSMPDNDIESVVGASKRHKKQKRERSTNGTAKGQPPSSLWDPKVSYQRIGNEMGSEADDVSGFS